MKILEQNSSNNGFTGDLGTYRPLSTADGSLTFYSEHFQEAFHNRDGAEGETWYNFIEGCQIASRAKYQPPVILEVGLGMGRGYPATLRALKGYLPGKLTFVALEMDSALIDWCRGNVPAYRNLKKVSKGVFSWWETSHDEIRSLVLPGDAVHTLPLARDLKLFPSVNSIYQDAFSPGKNPELWTPEWFALLKSLSSPDAILSTYSASPSVRKALLAAGFEVEERKGFGSKRSSFRAFACDRALRYHGIK